MTSLFQKVTFFVKPNITLQFFCLLLFSLLLLLYIHSHMQGLHAPGLVLLHSEAMAKLGEWQTVTVSRVEGTGSMTFHGHTIRSVSPAPTHSAALLDIHTEVFIGQFLDLLKNTGYY